MRVPLAAGPGPEAAQGEDSPASSTRDRILDAAETSFADRGFAGAGMREITRRCSNGACSPFST
jgi:AcrR family transcriptional regulator